MWGISSFYWGLAVGIFIGVNIGIILMAILSINRRYL